MPHSALTTHHRERTALDAGARPQKFPPFRNFLTAAFVARGAFAFPFHLTELDKRILINHNQPAQGA